jgi:hypothetical protein
MEQHTTTSSVLTVDQCQCLLQIWEKITYALIFTGQDRALCQAMLGARSVLNSDQATVNNARNQLARIFANLSIVEIKQLTLSYLTTMISGARTIIDHGRNTDLSAGTDESHMTSVCQSSGTSVDGRLANRTPAASESPLLADPVAAAQVDGADTDWEVSDILGKKVVDGEVQYLVDWHPTLVPEHALGNARELVDEFEARVRSERAFNSGRGRASGPCQ